MDYENLDGFSLKFIDRKNVVLGKNGCGKSYLLKKIEPALRSLPGIGKVRYISPERAGFLVYEPGIEQAIVNQATWMDDNRRHNQSVNFKQQSVALYRRLELLVLREIERDHILPGYKPKNFQTVIDKINTLLDRVKIERSDSGFKILEKKDGKLAQAQEISSGESQLVSLAIEFLSFVKECDTEKYNFLLIDEPDVHLHPDLQHRLAVFLSSEVNQSYISTIIATHSTSFMSALAHEGPVRVAFMMNGDVNLKFVRVTEVHKRVLPVFGAHPLSNVFNEAPILLVEGEDDERIWQQAVRTSLGKINVYPCVADSVDRLNEFEKDANDIISAVYDNARGYSLRDRDDNSEEIENIGNIVRMCLSCRTSENLMLSDDVLGFADTDWSKLRNFVTQFVQESINHPYHGAVKTFFDGGLNRKNADLKEIRMVLAGFISKKPWEVLVGQTIASLSNGAGLSGENSLQAYLGSKVCLEICRIT